MAEIQDHLRRVMLRRLKKDVQSQLPPKLRRVHEVELDEATFAQVERALVGSGRTVDDVVALLERDVVSFKEMSSVRAAIAIAKIPRLLEIVEDYEAQHVPLIVFSDHRAPIDAVGARPGWVTITGSQTQEGKDRAKDEFQEGFWAEMTEPHVVSPPGPTARPRKIDPAGNILYPYGIALTIKAGGTGLTLTRASKMLFVDRAWNPQVNSQAEGRADRIREARHHADSIDIGDIVSNHPLDARVFEVIVRKTKLFDASINVAAERDSGESDYAQQLREEHEAIAGGLVMRRGPVNGRERGAWEGLHTLVFDDGHDARIAADLAEQADTIGLSDKQWGFAIVITRKGRRHDEPPAVEVVVPPVVVASVVTESSLLEQGAVPTPVSEIVPIAPTKASPSSRALSPVERRRMEWAARRGGR